MNQTVEGKDWKNRQENRRTGGEFAPVILFSCLKEKSSPVNTEGRGFPRPSSVNYLLLTN